MRKVFMLWLFPAPMPPSPAETTASAVPSALSSRRAARVRTLALVVGSAMFTEQMDGTGSRQPWCARWTSIRCI